MKKITAVEKVLRQLDVSAEERLGVEKVIADFPEVDEYEGSERQKVDQLTALLNHHYEQISQDLMKIFKKGDDLPPILHDVFETVGEGFEMALRTLKDLP